MTMPSPQTQHQVLQAQLGLLALATVPLQSTKWASVVTFLLQPFGIRAFPPQLRLSVLQFAPSDGRVYSVVYKAMGIPLLSVRRTYTELPVWVMEISTASLCALIAFG